MLYSYLEYAVIGLSIGFIIGAEFAKRMVYHEWTDKADTSCAIHYRGKFYISLTEHEYMKLCHPKADHD